ncbi:MAG: ornithine carbamoyltransferase [Gammaproteobacteria bacterium]|nr:ornithine carbamoyltransferase [Gammaproteobacteria bacterium]NIM73949.1 ornithine carbamoyltransferase [Gammaproteobacteria bacterium]NIN38137.1 ornithine carbamoyltransferase [Gammaproteobacteria bacterium]NIO25730.1 ornithine carbamoyltransferase [Gammaproteobacteria bacterium]NIO66364.1 ornithine carbamoyltransferase [Gammaproteobacteria bacterium]
MTAARPRHFLAVSDLSREELQALLTRAAQMKRLLRAGERPTLFRGRVLAMVFEKSSTRTRVSFEAGMAKLGGHAIFLSPRDTQLGRGEPIEDTARIVSRMADAIVLRTFGHDRIETFAAHSQVPVINALTDYQHPCQVLADIQTYLEHRGTISGRTVVWVGDGNNMCNSFIEAAERFDFTLRIAAPPGYEPDARLIESSGARVELLHDAHQAAHEADLIVTDVWASMGHEDERARRLEDFSGFQVNARVISAAKPDALVMHCLPAHRGEEISTEVLEGPASVVWDEAENRLHAQMALVEFLLEC